MLADVKTRQPPNVDLGPEIILLEATKLADNSLFKSLIATDGRAHLFVADKEKQIHHAEVSGDVVILREILGAMEGTDRNQALDVVEHPAGTLRVLAGDKQFIRAASDPKWQEIKGNRCARFITAGDNLLCAFIANSKDIATPKRTDWTVGWFLLIPVVYWSNVDAEKLVLAQESKNGWTILAIFDPESKLSAWPDFMVGKDQQGWLHFLYRASGKSWAFFLFAGGYTGGGGSSRLGPLELRYARVHYEQLLSRATGTGDTGSGSGKPPVPWSSIQGLPLAYTLPFIEGDKMQKMVGDRETSHERIGPLDRQFALNGISGELGGLLGGYHIKIREGQWIPSFEIVATRDMPDSGFLWDHDSLALIKSDSKGYYHVLLSGWCPHWTWSWSVPSDIFYFVKTGANWSAPLFMGRGIGNTSQRHLAMDETGKVFAVWRSESDRVVGRWILPKN